MVCSYVKDSILLNTNKHSQIAHLCQLLLLVLFRCYYSAISKFPDPGTVSFGRLGKLCRVYGFLFLVYLFYLGSFFTLRSARRRKRRVALSCWRRGENRREGGALFLCDKGSIGSLTCLSSAWAAEGTDKKSRKIPLCFWCMTCKLRRTWRFGRFLFYFRFW